MHEVKPGKFDVRVLNQTVYWINREAEILRLEAMSSVHIHNVIAMLEDNPRHYHFAALVDAFINIAEGLIDGSPSREVLAYDLTGENLADIPPDVWLASTPLMRRMNQIRKEREC